MLTLTRRGEVQFGDYFRISDDSTQCGRRGSRALFYEVRITCPDDSLDEDGFIIDQLHIHEHIQAKCSRMRKLVSCEVLAIRTARELLKLCPSAVKVVVSIGMANGEGASAAPAYMTAELDNPTRSVANVS